MKRIVMAGFAAVVCMSMQTANAAGTLAVGDKVRLTNGPGGTSGGEFGIYETAASGSGTVDYDFRTFCVEKNQTVSFGSDFYVGGINLFSRHSSSGTVPLSLMAAALYRQYALGLEDYISSGGTDTTYDFFGDSSATYTYSGSLSASTLGNAASSDADDLQNAIWGAQGQQAAVTNKFTTAYFNAGTVNVGGVKVIDLRSGSATGAYRQDQLYWESGGDDFQSVPEPTSLALFGLGMVGAGFAQRRRKKAVA